MSSPASFTDWKNHILWALTLAAFSWGVWVTKEVIARPTVSQVEKIVSTEAPYLQDRKVLIQSVAKMLSAVEGNTDEIIKLRIGVAELRSELKD